MSKLKFSRSRKRVKYCPCGKSNKDNKFAPFVGYEDKGKCFSCGLKFLPEIENSTLVKPYKPEPPQPVSYHNPKLVSQSLKLYKQNNFVLFLKKIFNSDEVKTAISKYRIGTTKYYKGATIFWQIDNKNKVRHGKIVLYSSETCKKQKFNSVRSVLKLENFNLKQCLFGLHLINDVKTKVVAIVESEKTAILMSIFKPQYIWLATGGLTELKSTKLKPIKDFKIIAFPDKGKLKNWQEKALNLEKFGFDIVVNDWLEKQDYPNETDFADVLILEKQKRLSQSKKEIKEAEVSIPENCFSDIKKEHQKEIKQTDWSNDIAELEKYFANTELPAQQIKLNQCITVIDCSLFIESHFATVKANNGNKRYLPYLNRLQQLKILIQ